MAEMKQALGAAGAERTLGAERMLGAGAEVARPVGERLRPRCCCERV